ncbi:MAG: tRNA lysidine(34) synthetase TilS [Candidatus Dormibacteria bacterium]
MTAHGSSLAPAQRVPEVARLRRVVAAAIDRREVLRPHEVVVVGCSGGPDSTALLDALARLAPPRHLVLHVAHVDHGLRDGSAGDAVHVEGAAAVRDLPFHGLRVQVDGAASSLQDAARRARHSALRELGVTVGATAIALGHTADDQAETVLMRALSGATPRALRAMSERDGCLARPLLRVWRVDTVAYCKALGLAVTIDPANTDPRFLRTRVRHELLPALERVFPAARRRLVALADGQQRLCASLPANGSRAGQKGA